MTPASTRYDRFCVSARQWVRATRTMTLGLMLCFVAEGGLDAHLPAGSDLRLLVHRAMMAAAVWCLFFLFLQPFAEWTGEGESAIRWNRRTWYHIAAFATFILPFALTARIWSAPLAAAGMFALLWLRSTPEQRRVPIAWAGCLWAGVYPLSVGWPDSDRLYLAMTISGFALVVQGLVDIVRIPRNTT